MSAKVEVHTFVPRSNRLNHREQYETSQWAYCRQPLFVHRIIAPPPEPVLAGTDSRGVARAAAGQVDLRRPRSAFYVQLATSDRV